MRILHTSDWHLGRTLYGKKRDNEFAQFLTWLKNTIVQEKIDILLIAGDVFDTTTPPHSAQTLYYQFLCHVATTTCKHIVIIAGNHDSPSFLSAPKTILSQLNVHVVGSKGDNVTDEVLILEDNQSPMAIICAVPYLRDKDIRTFSSGESIDDKNAHLVQGLKLHYHQVCQAAVEQQALIAQTHHKKIPIIGMGHLFAAGGTTTDGDGVRDLYVGSLAYISADAFPSELDYVALGHLHSHQRVGQHNHIRYCGSPIPMGFGEANQTKKVLIIDIAAQSLNITELAIPVFQTLVRIKGDLSTINTTLDALISDNSDAWIEIEYTGTALVADLRGEIEQRIENTSLEIRRIKNRLIFDSVLKKEKETETLEDITPIDIFDRCLKANNILDEDEAVQLKTLFQKTLFEIENSLDSDNEEAL